MRIGDKFLSICHIVWWEELCLGCVIEEQLMLIADNTMRIYFRRLDESISDLVSLWWILSYLAVRFSASIGISEWNGKPRNLRLTIFRDQHRAFSSFLVFFFCEITPPVVVINLIDQRRELLKYCWKMIDITENDLV